MQMKNPSFYRARRPYIRVESKRYPCRHWCYGRMEYTMYTPVFTTSFALLGTSGSSPHSYLEETTPTALDTSVTTRGRTSGEALCPAENIGHKSAPPPAVAPVSSHAPTDRTQASLAGYSGTSIYKYIFVPFNSPWKQTCSWISPLTTKS